MKYLVVFENGMDGVELYELESDGTAGSDGEKLVACHGKYIGSDTWDEETWLNGLIDNWTKLDHLTKLDITKPLEYFREHTIIITGWVD